MEAILRRLPAQQQPAGHQLRLALVIPPPADPGEFRRRFGVTATTLYGLTDSGIPIGVPHRAALSPGRCGVTVPWWECRLVDENDDPVSGPGETGELIIRPRAPHIMMAEYLAEPQATLKAWRGLWFHTGDHMRQDEDGWFHFVGRRSDAIRRGGENISAYEVEQVLLAHDAVRKAAVFGVPSDVYGEEVMAVIQSPGFNADVLESVVAHCRANLPYFAVPRYVRVADDLPVTASEKIAKSQLKRAGVQPGTWDLGERKPRHLPAGDRG
jgi:crotonobetaine/carnitine-CoA ligase